MYATEIEIGSTILLARIVDDVVTDEGSRALVRSLAYGDTVRVVVEMGDRVAAGHLVDVNLPGHAKTVLVLAFDSEEWWAVYGAEVP